MATEKTKEVLGDIAIALADAEAQLPTARELVKILGDANEDVSEVRGLVTEIEARIKQWTRVLARQGVPVEPAPPSKTK